jgi:hypothetical protein
MKDTVSVTPAEAIDVRHSTALVKQQEYCTQHGSQILWTPDPYQVISQR